MYARICAYAPTWRAYAHTCTRMRVCLRIMYIPIYISIYIYIFMLPHVENWESRKGFRRLGIYIYMYICASTHSGNGEIAKEIPPIRIHTKRMKIEGITKRHNEYEIKKTIGK